MKKLLILILLSACLATLGFCSDSIVFSGGYTQVQRQGSEQKIVLTEGSVVETDTLYLKADSIEIWGKDYSLVQATGTVEAKEKDRSISLLCPSIFYDRISGLLSSDGWIEIQDTKNEAILSGAYMEFDLSSGMLLIQIQASILKATDKGLLSCTAQSISYDSEKKTLILAGDAKVDWDGDLYQASMIRIDIDTEEIHMDGWVTGTVNG